jgi:hypothetical protein
MIDSAGLDDEYLEERLHAVRVAIEARDCTPLIELYPPVPEDEIEAAEVRLGRRFPQDHRNFLKLHDGAMLGVGLYIRSVPVQFRVNVLRTRDVIARTEYAREKWTDSWSNKLAFAEYPEANLCAFAPPKANGDAAVLDIPDANPLAPEKIADSFTAWVEHVFDAVATRGEHFTYWLPKKINNI